ncbi:hypothetical protein FB451DRAFT_1170447 [Mycena latifolia]|nr:hypothetical protein FB451DRAFT_1170447 [Mycena latifolia]
MSVNLYPLNSLMILLRKPTKPSEHTNTAERPRRHAARFGKRASLDSRRAGALHRGKARISSAARYRRMRSRLARTAARGAGTEGATQAQIARRTWLCIRMRECRASFALVAGSKWRARPHRRLGCPAHHTATRAPVCTRIPPREARSSSKRATQEEEGGEQISKKKKEKKMYHPMQPLIEPWQGPHVPGVQAAMSVANSAGRMREKKAQGKTRRTGGSAERRRAVAPPHLPMPILTHLTPSAHSGPSTCPRLPALGRAASSPPARGIFHGGARDAWLACWASRAVRRGGRGALSARHLSARMRCVRGFRWERRRGKEVRGGEKVRGRRQSGRKEWDRRRREWGRARKKEKGGSNEGREAGHERGKRGRSARIPSARPAEPSPLLSDERIEHIVASHTRSAPAPCAGKPRESEGVRANGRMCACIKTRRARSVLPARLGILVVRTTVCTVRRRGRGARREHKLRARARDDRGATRGAPRRVGVKTRAQGVRSASPAHDPPRAAPLRACSVRAMQNGSSGVGIHKFEERREDGPPPKTTVLGVVVAANILLSAARVAASSAARKPEEGCRKSCRIRNRGNELSGVSATCEPGYSADGCMLPNSFFYLILDILSCSLTPMEVSVERRQETQGYSRMERRVVRRKRIEADLISASGCTRDLNRCCLVEDERLTRAGDVCASDLPAFGANAVITRSESGTGYRAQFRALLWDKLTQKILTSGLAVVVGSGLRAAFRILEAAYQIQFGPGRADGDASEATSNPLK